MNSKCGMTIDPNQNLEAKNSKIRITKAWQILILANTY